MVRVVHAGDSIHHTDNQHFPMTRRTPDEQVQAMKEQVISPGYKPNVKSHCKAQSINYKVKSTSRPKQIIQVGPSGYDLLLFYCNILLYDLYK